MEVFQLGRLWDRGKVKPEDVSSSNASTGSLEGNDGLIILSNPPSAPVDERARPWALKVKYLAGISVLLLVIVAAIIGGQHHINRKLQGIGMSSSHLFSSC